MGAPIDLDRPRMRYTDDSLLPVLTLSILEIADGKVHLKVGEIDIESGIDIANSQVQITPDGASMLTIPFSEITFDSATGVGSHLLSITPTQVTPSTPLQVYAVVQDNAGNKQSITRTIERINLAAGSLQFTLSSNTVAENTTTLPLTVERSDGDEGAVSVNYAVTSGTASTGSDYLLTSGTLTWSDGDSQNKKITLTIVDDSVVEGDEIPTVTLSSPTNGATLGAQQMTIITIEDNESAGVLQFSIDEIAVTEASATIELLVTRRDGSDGAITVDYVVNNDSSATKNSDFILSGTLSWAGGDTTDKVLVLEIIENNDFENEEQLTITLVSPSNFSSLGATDSMTIVIDDNDAAASNNSGGGGGGSYVFVLMLLGWFVLSSKMRRFRVRYTEIKRKLALE